MAPLFLCMLAGTRGMGISFVEKDTRERRPSEDRRYKVKSKDHGEQQIPQNVRTKRGSG
jgi:hypothetical protein